MIHLAVVLLMTSLFLSSGTVLAKDVEAKGRSLLNGLGCKACHRFGGQGGQIGPALDKVGARLSRDRIRQQILTPRNLNPDSSMPSYSHLDKQDIDTLVEFLGRQE